MELSNQRIFLHVQAKDYLFRYYKTLKRIFNNVLGHLEIDYIAIALLNKEHELFFLSSSPAIEQNLIEYNLWQLDPCLQFDFFINNTPLLWNTVYCTKKQKLLHYYKIERPDFSAGISIASNFSEHAIIYSFALRSKDIEIQKKLTTQIETLLSIGHFCFQDIVKTVPLPDRKGGLASKKPYLKLIINNKVGHENIT